MGKYARMRLWYLKEHQPALYTSLLFSGKLNEHLSEIETSAQAMMESIISCVLRRPAAAGAELHGRVADKPAAG